MFNFLNDIFNKDNTKNLEEQEQDQEQEPKDEFKQKLISDIESIMEYSQNVEGPWDGIPELVDRWYEAKKWFIDAFGSTIYEFEEPVTFDIGKEKRADKANSFCDKIAQTYQNEYLADFVFANKDNFHTNIMQEDYDRDYEDTDSHFHIKKGSKIIKAFKFFETDKDALTTLQNLASMIVQENKVTGKFCISVDPRDFLSCSENSYNWSSCHSLTGEYRGGDVSYMLDSATVICYLKGEDEAILPDFPIPWNSKKWRMWLHLSDDRNYAAAGRQYPFFSEAPLTFIREEVLRLLANERCKFSKWDKELIESITVHKGEPTEHEALLNDSYLLLDNTLISKHDFIRKDSKSLFFDDLFDSNYYVPYFSQNEYAIFNPNHSRIHMGGSCTCLKCGKNIITDHESFMCNDCEFKYVNNIIDNDEITYCDRCGVRIWTDDAYFVENGETLCSTCAEAYTQFCEKCGGTYYNEDIHYDPESKQLRCIYCYSDWKKIKYKGE